jgi:hypothetical protein
VIQPTRRQRKQLETENRQWPEMLRQVPPAEWPYRADKVIEMWRSRRFLVQVYQESNGIERLSINTTSIDGGSWLAGLGWDTLQSLKAQCGRGDKEAVEIFPADVDVVNVANMRHLWVLPEKLPFGWKKS